MHPSDSSLQGYLAGDGTVDGRRELEQHFDACSECRQVLHALAQKSEPGLDLTLQQAAPPEVAAFLDPTELGHKFRLDRVLGEGGMGVVVAAWHRVLGQPVAIKFLHPKVRGSAEAEERFITEARAATRLLSPHVVRVMDVERTRSGVPYIVMELLEGEDLAQRLSRGPVPLDETLRLTVQILDGLAEAHAAKVVHRDLKPANLFLTRNARGTTVLKMLDFGLAKVISAESASVTQTGQALGSPHFMSPEQLRGAREVDVRTDLWSLGCVLYQLLTRRLPFAGTSFAEVAASIQRDQPVAPSALEPSVPKAFDELVLALLRKDPAQRPSSVAEVAARLRPLAPADCQATLSQLMGPLALSSSLEGSGAARPGSGRTAWWAAGAVALAAAIGLAWLKPWQKAADASAAPTSAPVAAEPKLSPPPAPPLDVVAEPPPSPRPKPAGKAAPRAPSDRVFDERE